VILEIISCCSFALRGARQGLAGQYQMSEKNTNNFFIGNFTFLTQLCDFLLCFDLLFLMKGLVTSRC
jgi:hypothetical protein